MKTIPPLDKNDPDQQAALELIRSKLDKIYDKEPDAREELAEAETSQHRSKHQAYMHKLNQSGKSLAEIQTAWHEYYAELSDTEKHKVWQEFYQEHDRVQKKPDTIPAPEEPKQHAAKPIHHDNRSVAEVKQSITRSARVAHKRKLTKQEHLKSLLFGLSAGLIVVVIFMFGLFNERFIAPFITPSKTVSNSAIIIDPSSTSVGPEPKLIIPKINAELPVIYDQKAIDENSIQKALEEGVVHYSTTSMPGENGNGAIFGHSSNNILNKGKYKFAFVLLRRLEVGDTFIVQRDGKRYVYRVFTKQVVPPTQVSVLHETHGKTATFSLITCDPPGTSTNRLVVTGEQITPDPADNKAASPASTSSAEPAELPSNSPSLWSRITGWLF